jgi:hypothetical protein
MTSPPASRGGLDDPELELPGFAPAEDAPHSQAEPAADDEPASRPEPDRWTQELPLSEPAAGLGADIVNDVTQIYLNEIGQHVLLSAAEELARAGDGGRRFLGAAAADRAQPAARRQHREAYTNRGSALPDLIEEGNLASSTRSKLTRARLPLHDVRDVVDPA